MELLFVGVMLLGSVIALSGIIIAKSPNAKQTIDKLMPFQAIIGVAMFAFGIWGIIHFLPYLSPSNFKSNALNSAAILAMIGSAILLGVLFGMPQFVKWIPNPQGNQKVAEIAAKVAPFQVLIGIAALGATLAYLYFRFINVAIPFPD